MVMYDVGYTDTKAFRELFKNYQFPSIEYHNKYNKQPVLSGAEANFVF